MTSVRLDLSREKSESASLPLPFQDLERYGSSLRFDRHHSRGANRTLRVFVFLHPRGWLCITRIFWLSWILSVYHLHHHGIIMDHRGSRRFFGSTCWMNHFEYHGLIHLSWLPPGVTCLSRTDRAKNGEWEGDGEASSGGVWSFFSWMTGQWASIFPPFLQHFSWPKVRESA